MDQSLRRRQCLISRRSRIEPSTPCACPSGGGRFEGGHEGAGLPDEGIPHTPTRGDTQTPLPSSEVRRTAVVYLCLCYRTTADTTRRSAALYGFQLRYPLFLPISAIKPRPLARFHPQHRAEIAAQYTLDHFWVWGRMRGVRHRLDRPDRWHANAHPDSSRVGDWGGVRPAMGPAIGFRWERGLLRWVEFES